MIIGGLQTGNTRWLAAHLQNAADNESIELVEVTGSIARDIDGALVEFDAYTAGTRASEGVYACFINPPEPLTRLQYAQALAHIEKRLGLEGQPRIVVFHVKNGREHCHVVWSRIDTRAMKAIHLSHDRQKLRRCARELAAEFGTELPPGLANDRGAARWEELPQPTRAEKAMETASGLSREERRRIITGCYRNSDSADAFVNALEASGFMLARGDKRVFVVVDTAGDVHSLARQIDGAKTKDVKKKLEGLTLSLLPPVDRAKVLMLGRAAAQQDARRTDEKKSAAARQAYDRLSAIQRQRRLALDGLWQAMKIRQMHEWKVLLAHLKAQKEYRIARRHFRAVGLALYLKKIAVIRQLIDYYLTRRKRRMDIQHKALMDGLRLRHENEARELRRRYAAVDRLERRELYTIGRQFGAPPSAIAGEPLAIWQARYELGEHHAPLYESSSYILTVLAEQVSLRFVGEIELTALPPETFPEHSHVYLSGYSGTVTAFHENAADITAATVTVRFLDDTEAVTAGSTGGHGPNVMPPAWPGAG